MSQRSAQLPLVIRVQAGVTKQGSTAKRLAISTATDLDVVAVLGGALENPVSPAVGPAVHAAIPIGEVDAHGAVLVPDAPQALLLPLRVRAPGLAPVGRRSPPPHAARRARRERRIGGRRELPIPSLFRQREEGRRLSQSN